MIANLDFPNEKIEAIFVEGNSNDDTLSLIKHFVHDLKIKYKIFSNKTKKLGLSREIVLENAQGDYIVWIDDGTIIPKKYVRLLEEVMEHNTNIGIATGILGKYSGSNTVATLENMMYIASIENMKNIDALRNSNVLTLYEKQKEKNTVKLPGTSGSIYRVKAAKQAGGFDKRNKGVAEDTDIACRIMKLGWKIFIIPIFFYRDYNMNFVDVFKANLWSGYGSHFVLHKNKELYEIFVKSTPPAGFLQGILSLNVVYRITHRKIALLLPFFYFLCRTAFCLGYFMSHFDSYGH
jgi:cellulose synthase/poly-beta-1,6-N-acetylglucosamine synthase-like glycosyltransferase